MKYGNAAELKVFSLMFLFSFLYIFLPPWVSLDGVSFLLSQHVLNHVSSFVQLTHVERKREQCASYWCFS